MTVLTVEPRIGWLWSVRQIECVINFLDPEPSSNPYEVRIEGSKECRGPPTEEEFRHLSGPYRLRMTAFRYVEAGRDHKIWLSSMKVLMTKKKMND
eukprot:scaffold5024_cov105-Skeletonema_dohrnii-CCMP3373.AAC.1